MILTMAYLLLIAALIGAAALPAERICAGLGRPRRLAWLSALTASVVLPALAINFSAGTASAPFISLPLAFDLMPIGTPAPTELVVNGTLSAPSLRWPDWQLFDQALMLIWGAASLLMLLLCAGMAWQLRRVLRASESIRIAGREVLLSDSLGPAVFGFLRPRIVLPRWLAEQNTSIRSLVLRHESEHIAARDQLSLLGALLLITLMPWNIALWWQLRRLRRAIEIDCDRRVLSDGADPRQYSAALLTVGRRGMRSPLGAIALTEPVSELEGRITVMLDQASHQSISGLGARSVLVIAMLGLAFAINAPSAQQAVPAQPAAAGDQPADDARSAPSIRTPIWEGLVDAKSCLDADDTACAFEVLAAIDTTAELNTYETAQVLHLRAVAHDQLGDTSAAIETYQTLLGLPVYEIPQAFVAEVTRNLATLHLAANQPEIAVMVLDARMTRPDAVLFAEDHYLRASILHYLGRFDEAVDSALLANVSLAEPRESYLLQLYMLQGLAGDSEGARETLQLVNELWPSTNNAALLASLDNEPLRPAPRAREYLPIEPVAPIYPSRAAARGVEGYVVVEYTVDTAGGVRGSRVVESSSTLFEGAAIDAVNQYLYRPRIIDGIPVEVAGVRSRIEFVLDD